MYRERCSVTGNKKVAPGHHVLVFRSGTIAQKAAPGQFVQISCADPGGPFLPRPFSFYWARGSEFAVLYRVVGKGTRALSQARRGDKLWVLGPLGNGFSPHGRRKTDDGRHKILLVGGGVGIPPLYHWAEHVSKVEKFRFLPDTLHVFLGARTKSLLLCERQFRKLGFRTHLATDDGSRGKKAFVTDVLEDFLMEHGPRFTRILACGPTPMLKAVSALSEKFGTLCEVSVEVPMACGFGVCLGCAVKVKADRRQAPRIHKASGADRRLTPHRFAMACTEGPVFGAERILWD